MKNTGGVARSCVGMRIGEKRDTEWGLRSHYSGQRFKDLDYSLSCCFKHIPEKESVLMKTGHRYHQKVAESLLAARCAWKVHRQTLGG